MTIQQMLLTGGGAVLMPTQGNLGGSKASERSVTSGTGYGGFKFTAGGSGLVYASSATAQVGSGPGSGGISYHLELWSDNAGSPGTLLTNGVGSDFLVSNLTNTNVTSTFPNKPTMIAGVAYWLIISYGSFPANPTNFSTQSDGGTHHSGRNTTITSIVTTDNQPNTGEDWFYQIN